MSKYLEDRIAKLEATLINEDDEKLNKQDEQSSPITNNELLRIYRALINDSSASIIDGKIKSLLKLKNPNNETINCSINLIILKALITLLNK